MSENSNLSRNAEKYAKHTDKIMCSQKNDTKNLRLTNSISMNFLKQMTVQYCSAIEMCKNILCFTTCLSTQNLADELKCSFENFVKEMEELNDKCLKSANQRQELYFYQNNFDEIADKMFFKLDKICNTNDINQDFRNYVHMLCEGLVYMCNIVLKFRIMPEIRELAEKMKKCFESFLDSCY